MPTRSVGVVVVICQPSSLAIGQPLAVDAAGCPGQSLETFGGDLLAAANARSERPLVEPCQRGVDERELLVRPVAQREIALLGEHLARGRRLRAVGHRIGGDDGRAAFLEQARSLGAEGGSEGLEVDSGHGSIVPERILQGSTHEEREMAIEIDPVCGMEVDTDTSVLSTEYEGRTWWFCSRGCLLEFTDDPEKYLSPDHQPQM